MKLTYGMHLASHKTNRGGVIPYTIYNGKVYYLLAKHLETGELGDFGGGIKKNEFSLNGAIREFAEESNGIFSSTYASPNDFLDKIALVDGNKMAIIFAPVDNKWLKGASTSFINRKSPKKGSDEISEIIWINETSFLAMVNEKRQMGRYKLWRMIQHFLKGYIETITKALKISFPFETPVPRLCRNTETGVSRCLYEISPEDAQNVGNIISEP